MKKRSAALPLPQYGLKEKDYASKKSWQSARARQAGYKSYADWLSSRRSTGVQKTNEGRASATYKARPQNEKTYSQRREFRTESGKVLGIQYYFNVKENGWGPYYSFINSLDPQANVVIIMKTNTGDIRTYNSRTAVGRIQKISSYGKGDALKDSMERVTREQSPDRRKSEKPSKKAQKPDEITMIYVRVYDSTDKKIKKY